LNSNVINSISIQKLFGIYTYDIPEVGNLSDAAILYGDNGVGKSTILRLVFHLLSPARNRGHRTALIKADFEKLTVKLASGIAIAALHNRDEGKNILELEISENDRKIASWHYRPNSKVSPYEDDEIEIIVTEDGEHVIKRRKRLDEVGNSDEVLHGESAYLQALTKYVPSMFILNAERRLDSDTVSDPSDEVELRRILYDEPKRINELVVRSREIALSQALNSAAKSIISKAVRGANQGSNNVHSVYGDVLRRLAVPKEKATSEITNEKIAELINRLSRIDKTTSEQAKFELATHLSTDEFKQAIQLGAEQNNHLAIELLTPYVESLESRLNAIEPIYSLINRFVEIINSLLRDKTIAFKLGQGFSIQNSRGNTLTPAQLSSGEQQLLLLFCYVITARDKPSVFMIDEPELSLNVKWQRQLVQALLSITAGASIQFIFASHSIELLAQHRELVVQLKQ
jgi:predicted ATP-binding protein involved in virulence